MIEAESILMRTSAELALAQVNTYQRACEAKLPEPMQELAALTAKDAVEMFEDIVSRYLRQLSKGATP